MIVKCVDNTGINLPENILVHNGWNTSMIFDEITIGKKYVVYAIIHVKNIPCYLVCSDIFDGQYITYPSLLPHSLFKTVQDKQSKFWYSKDGSEDIGFKEILQNEYFYGNLVEGYEKEVQMFLTIKRKIDQENIA